MLKLYLFVWVAGWQSNDNKIKSANGWLAGKERDNKTNSAKLKLGIGLKKSNVLKKNIRNFYKVKLFFKFKNKNKITKKN